MISLSAQQLSARHSFNFSVLPHMYNITGALHYHAIYNYMYYND